MMKAYDDSVNNNVEGLGIWEKLLQGCLQIHTHHITKCTGHVLYMHPPPVYTATPYG